jgi:hypothetical protein
MGVKSGEWSDIVLNIWKERLEQDDARAIPYPMLPILFL